MGLALLRSTLQRRTEPSLPRSSGVTLIHRRWKNSGSASPIVTLREIGILNQLAEVSSSLTGILGSQTMVLGVLEARTVPISTASVSGMIASVSKPAPG